MCNWVQRRLPALFVSACSACVLFAGIILIIEAVYLYTVTPFATLDIGGYSN